MTLLNEIRETWRNLRMTRAAWTLLKLCNPATEHELELIQAINRWITRDLEHQLRQGAPSNRRA